MDWNEKAIRTLKNSSFLVPVELNEFDWKSGLSSKTDRVAQHISAFANYKDGGMLVYGVNNDGTCFNISKENIDLTIEKFGNIAKNNLCYSLKRLKFDNHYGAETKECKHGHLTNGKGVQ